MIGENFERLRAHRKNIGRYRRLLTTRLSELEREFIERRLKEEEACVKELMKALFPDRLSVGLGQTMAKCEIDTLLHPAQAFSHPLDVVDDYDLTSYEKRAILSSWAAEACTVKDGTTEGRPFHGTGVSFDDVLDALRLVDSELERPAAPDGGLDRHSDTKSFGGSPSLPS